MEDRLDYLILAPLELETDALRAALGALSCKRQAYQDGTAHWRHTLDVNGTNSRPVTIDIVQLKQQGVLQAATTTTSLLHLLRPICVVSFGIAGGFVGDDAALGDVVVAESLFYYEPAKEGHRPGHRNFEGDRADYFARVIPFTTDEQLIQKCREIWNPDRKRYDVRFGPVASGEKLIANINAGTRKVILSLNDKMLAVEMEAAGVAVAVREAAAAGNESRLLVLKGISDPATNAKRRSKKYRRLAVKRAADLLAKLIRATELEDDEHLARFPMFEIRKRAEALCRSLDPWIYKPIDPVLAARVLRSLDDLPPLFYQWRQLHTHIHWVDFHYLLVIRRAIAELPLPVLLFTSDVEEAVAAEGRRNTEAVVAALLGNRARIFWYEDTLRDRDKYTRYAQAKGFDEQVVKLLRNMKTPYRRDRGRLITEHWLQYMGWIARDKNRCIYLCWHRHAAIAEKLLHFLEFTPLMIYRPTLSLDGKVARKSRLRNEPLIDPPRYDSIFGWLETKPSLQAVSDFVRYFDIEAISDRQAEAETTAQFDVLLSAREPLERALSSNDEFALEVRKLVRRLSYWNCTFFKGW